MSGNGHNDHLKHAAIEAGFGAAGEIINRVTHRHIMHPHGPGGKMGQMAVTGVIAAAPAVIAAAPVVAGVLAVGAAGAGIAYGIAKLVDWISE